MTSVLLEVVVVPEGETVLILVLDEPEVLMSLWTVVLGVEELDELEEAARLELAAGVFEAWD